MIRLRSKNLVDYERMRAIGSGADISYIDNGWLVGRGSNYGRMIVNLSTCTFAQGETYYIVADVECLFAGKVRNFSAIRLYDSVNSILGNLIVGKLLSTMSVGDKQRVVYKCYIPKKPNNSKNRISVYNSYNSANPDNTGDSFKITNLCFFKEDYTIDYVPYWYEPSKIMTRHNGSMSEVKTIAYGVKDECKIVLDGSEVFGSWMDGSTSIGFAYSDDNFSSDYPAIYNNVFGGFYASGVRGKIFIRKLSGISALYCTWTIGSPPYPSWETTDANGKAIANIPQIKADLAKKNLVVYYDNTNSKPKTLAGLLKIVRREVYNQFIAVVDGDTLEVSGKMSDGVLELDSNKARVSGSTLQLGGVIPQVQ